jgi:serine/threonine-protein kinase
MTQERFDVVRDALVGTRVTGADGASYLLDRLIGSGGQGWVFRAIRGELVVIVKVLRPDAADDDALRRFRREARVLRVLSEDARPSPHVVRFYDHAVTEVQTPNGVMSLPFTVLEHVSGTSLARVLDEHHGSGLPLDRVKRILRQVSNALAIVHAQRVIHRDLKPSNILLTTEEGDEIAKVTDFGFARLAEVNPATTSVLVGVTLGYAPPEQYEKGNPRVSVRTDVFSLAAIAYEMLAGEPAFPFGPNDNPLRLVARMMTGPRPSLASASNPSPELAGRLDRVRAIDRELSRALASDPSDRHASIEELIESIEPLLVTAEVIR